MPSPIDTPGAIVGQSESHLLPEADGASIGARLHRDVLGPFLALKESAARSGFDLRILSGFRSFDRQLSIWNRKASGELVVLDSAALPIDITALSERELVLSILRWSALPGASRHHWGTDVDVYDASDTPTGYEIQLIPAEVDARGMHGPLHEWLDAQITTGTSFDFYRPYDVDRDGVAPERWHLSHATIASDFERRLTPDVMRVTIEGSDMRLKDTVLDNLDYIYRRFVSNVGRRSHGMA